MTKTQRKEIETKIRALVTKEGGVVKAAAKLGLTAVTVNSVLAGQRIYRKTETKLQKKFGYPVEVPEAKDAPKKTARKLAKAKAAKAAKPVKKVKKAKLRTEKPKKPNKIKPVAEKPTRKAKRKVVKEVTNGVAGPTEAAVRPETVSTIDAV